MKVDSLGCFGGINGRSDRASAETGFEIRPDGAGDAIITMCAAGVKDAFDHARGTFARQERHQPARGV